MARLAGQGDTKEEKLKSNKENGTFCENYEVGINALQKQFCTNYLGHGHYLFNLCRHSTKVNDAILTKFDH